MNLVNTPKIVTERLILRKFTVNDLDALFFIYADKEVNIYLPWFPIKNLEETKVLLEERYLKAYLKPQGYNYAICLKHDNTPVGYVNVGMDDSYDFGYGLCKEFWHPNLPKLLYIGFKLNSQKPYKINILSMFFFTNICINDIIKVENYTYVGRNHHGIFSLFKT